MAKASKLLLIGGGGHGRSVLDALVSGNEKWEIGIVDPLGKEICGYPCVGGDDDLSALFALGWTHAFIGVGSIGNTSLRTSLFGTLKQIGFQLPVISDPSASIAKNVMLGEGTFVGKQAVVNTGAQVGRCCILNSACVVEHDCNVGDFVHISPGAVLCGNVRIGHHTHVGAGATVVQEIAIGNHSLIGAGSVVLHEIGNGIVAYGNPCREVKKA